MAPLTIHRSSRTPLPWLIITLTMTIFICGCSHVAGNYPLAHVRPICDKAGFNGDGFRLWAGSRLRLDRLEAELDQLKGQGFSRRDPQIIRDVARRRHIPVGLLTDRSNNGYYRFTARLDPGIRLTLAPGALKVTVRTRAGTAVVQDQGYLLEDPRHPEGCRPPPRASLDLGSADRVNPVVIDFLVRLPVRGEIVDLTLITAKCEADRESSSP